MADASRDNRVYYSLSSNTRPVEPLVAAIAEFGRTVGEKLGRGGSPEAQLSGPVEILLKRIGKYVGVDTVAYGEVTLKHLRARPDYAVDLGNSRVGYIELKAPGRGVPPDWGHVRGAGV